MFTGIVEGVARVKSLVKTGKGGSDAVLILKLGKKLSQGLKAGDSVCISGACLTVTKISKGGEAEFEVVAETARRTSLGALAPGDNVNVERSLRVGDRLEGHFVLGHVDGVGVVDEIVKMPSETTIWITVDKPLLDSMVPKGAIAVDGVSLTLVDIETDRVSISLIPHTLGRTTFGMRSKGDRVNIETDILGKYVARNIT